MHTMSNNESSDEVKLLISKLKSQVNLCEKTNAPQFTKFLTSQQIAAMSAASHSNDAALLFFGGYEQAERKLCGIFPSFLCDGKEQELFPIKLILAKGSGYRTLTHRDFLGSVLSLGISREVLGDIIVTDDGYSAYIFVLETITDYILNNFSLAANDKISCSLCRISDLPYIQKKYSEIIDTVSSLRADAVVAAILNISRDKAEKLITSGFVSQNHTELFKKDKLFCEGDTISIRTYGRFLLFEIGRQNKKGRTRINVRKFI